MFSQPQTPVMASSVFTSKQHKLPRNLKKLLISSPMPHSPLNSPTSSGSPIFGKSVFPVVVLRAKYDFSAQNLAEISIRGNDYFKLLDRPGNGWLMVQCIDRNDTGLVPALYVEIAINDPKRPVSIEWLTRVKSPKLPIMDEIKSISVSTVLLDSNNQTWYRLEIQMFSGVVKHVAKYFQEFQHLHLCLVEELQVSEKLPSPPRPLRTSSKPEPASWVKQHEKNHMKQLVTHCEELDRYMNTLLAMDDVLLSEPMVDFVVASTSKWYEVPSHRVVAGDIINESLLPQSFNVTAAVNELRKLSFSPTAPLPPVLNLPSSLSTSSMKPFSYSNTKYLSYLNQSASAPCSPVIRQHPTRENQPSRSPQKSTISESRSSQTLCSFGSLFASYDTSSEESPISPLRDGPAISPKKGDYYLRRATTPTRISRV